MIQAYEEQVFCEVCGTTSTQRYVIDTDLKRSWILLPAQKASHRWNLLSNIGEDYHCCLKAAREAGQLIEYKTSKMERENA